VLRAVRDAGVERVVQTSSSAAIGYAATRYNGMQPPGTTVCGHQIARRARLQNIVLPKACAQVDVALLRHETQTAGLAYRVLLKEPLIAILPICHHLAARKAVRPEELARETFVSTARIAPVLKAVIDDYAAKVGITLKQNYDAETVSGGMSLVASTGGFTLVPLYVRNALISSVVARLLYGEVPTIDLMMGYSKSNTSPLLKRFPSRADELVGRGSQKQDLLGHIKARR
jgi:DNA-binding transcriptional LysR family regulator